MAGIVILGHGEFPAALKSSAQMIAGELAQVRTEGLFPGETPQTFRDKVQVLFDEEVPQIVLTDLPGGTPDNVMALLSKQYPDVLVISGASLPLVLELSLGVNPGNSEITDEFLLSVGPKIRTRKN